MSDRPYRSRHIQNKLIALSIAYEPEDLLARGLGREHLRELLQRIARPLLRQGANLAHGGHWRNSPSNFTYELLNLINAEQEDNSLGGPDTSYSIGRLYNHCAWPYYLDISPMIEAQWINCCRIVRVTQEDAGISASDVVSDSEADEDSDQRLLNAALALSAMRRLTMEGMQIRIPDVPQPEHVPPVDARVVLGGKLRGYSGFLPGIFEEALFTLERNSPLYVIGGFGGAGEALATAILMPGKERSPALTVEWHRERTPSLEKLLQLSATNPVPANVRSTESAFDVLNGFIRRAKSDLSGTLNTGLNDEETRELLLTRDMHRAVRLVLQGLESIGLRSVPA